MTKYVKGDATYPKGEGNKLLIHICNDIGAWGKGFVLAISKRWSLPEILYKSWTHQSLGMVQYVPVTDTITIANMIAQHTIWNIDGKPPIRYDALEKCLEDVAIHARLHSCSIHLPKIGSGLAGGDWCKIESIIEEKLSSFNVTVYEID